MDTKPVKGFLQKQWYTAKNILGVGGWVALNTAKACAVTTVAGLAVFGTPALPTLAVIVAIAAHVPLFMATAEFAVSTGILLNRPVRNRMGQLVDGAEHTVTAFQHAQAKITLISREFWTSAVRREQRMNKVVAEMELLQGDIKILDPGPQSGNSKTRFEFYVPRFSRGQSA